jgi:hypothetical protein
MKAISLSAAASHPHLCLVHLYTWTDRESSQLRESSNRHLCVLDIYVHALLLPLIP